MADLKGQPLPVWQFQYQMPSAFFLPRPTETLDLHPRYGLVDWIEELNRASYLGERSQRDR
jgi:hypothetical protein